jgi:hypothetical protein
MKGMRLLRDPDHHSTTSDVKSRLVAHARMSLDLGPARQGMSEAGNNLSTSQGVSAS